MLHLDMLLGVLALLTAVSVWTIVRRDRVSLTPEDLRSRQRRRDRLRRLRGSR